MSSSFSTTIRNSRHHHDWLKSAQRRRKKRRVDSRKIAKSPSPGFIRRRDGSSRTSHGPRGRESSAAQRHGGGEDCRVQAAGIGISVTPSEMADTLLKMM